MLGNTVLIGLLLAWGPGWSSHDELHRKVTSVGPCLLGPKGGVGAAGNDSYVFPYATKNVVGLGRSGQWAGKDVGEPELVVEVDGQVHAPDTLPSGFDARQAIAIAFEPDKIYVYRLHERDGCYYEREPCPPSEPQVVVGTKAHKLWLCERGLPVTSHQVALGRGGTNKRIEGDSKTPLGSYPLGEPRPSARFGTFIPVAYPTPEQRRQGFTGTDVGIHGPDRRFRWAGRMNTWFDWTAGCVALATDEEAQSVASWVRERKPGVSFY